MIFMKNKFWKVTYNFENVPNFLMEPMKNEFMAHRNEVVKIINPMLDKINEDWKLTGKKAMLGSYAEDINPEYIEFMKKYIKPYLDEINKKMILCYFGIDETGDVIGYIPTIEKSRIYITLQEVEA